MIERSILTATFSLSDFPVFPCPRCKRGDLHPIEKPEAYHPQHSQDTYSQEWAGVEVIELSSSVVAQCSNPRCADRSVVLLKGRVFDCYNPDGSSGYDEAYRIASFFPSPHIMELPGFCPEEISAPLEHSFSCFWFNRSLALNALRNSLEALVDHLGIPSSDGTKWISLGNRLKVLEDTNADAAKLIALIKPFVNAGSHQSEVATETLLDCYEAYELFLGLHFDDRAMQLEALQTKLGEAAK